MKNKNKNNHKTNKPKTNKKDSFLKVLIIKIPLYIFKLISNFLLLIIKLPFLLYNLIKKTTNYTKKKIEQLKIESKRNKIEPIYNKFEILKTDSGNYDLFEKEIFNSDSKIGIIIGARGSGKSAFGVKFLENLYYNTKKKCYAIGFNNEDMPSWIEVIADISQIKNNSFILIDEGGVLFSSRDSMSKANKMLSDLILISRHKNLSILFIAQNSANLDIDIIRQADYLVFKKSSLLQLDFERKKIQEIYKKINPDFEIFNDKSTTYIYSDKFSGFIKSDLPSFWTTNISKSFSKK